MKDSRNLRGAALVKYKKTLKLTNVQKEIIVGTSLGDASITKTAKEPNIKFEQSSEKAEYVDHLYENFADFVREQNS